MKENESADALAKSASRTGQLMGEALRMAGVHYDIFVANRTTVATKMFHRRFWEVLSFNHPKVSLWYGKYERNLKRAQIRTGSQSVLST